MPKNRKYFPHNSVLFITTRTEIGLPFAPTLVMNFILWGILASAKEKFNIKVCHFVFLSNHLHMLVVVDSPEDVSRFMGYIKTESAHAVNRLLGRAQRTIWQDGYDSPLILTSEDAQRYIRYIYLNPAKANLEECISRYPGVSSWQMFVNGAHSIKCKRLSRRSITRLSNPALSINEQRRLVDKYNKLPGTEHRLSLEPNAWIDCFPELSGVPVEEINSRLISEIKAEQRKLSRLRSLGKKTVIGSTSLRRQSMLREHVPEKRSRRMICICSDIDFRTRFIETFKSLCEKARKVYLSWKRGDFKQKIPPGLFAPRMPTLVSAISV